MADRGERCVGTQRLEAPLRALVEGDPDVDAREARIEEYARRVAERGWIFKPPTPAKSLAWLQGQYPS